MSTFLFLCEHCFGKVAFTARLKAMYKARRALYIGLEADFFLGGGGLKEWNFKEVLHCQTFKKVSERSRGVSRKM